MNATDKEILVKQYCDAGSAVMNAYECEIIRLQYADARFERTQPAALKRVPFAQDDIEVVPGAVEAIGWVFLAFATGILFVGFLGL